MSAATLSASAYLKTITSRRTFYALGKGAAIPDAKLVPLVKEIVRQTPSSFNSQSSRVVFLLGKDHDEYWSNTVPTALKAVAPKETLPGALQRLEQFHAARLTILFYESQNVVKGLQEQIPAYADAFPQWSAHSSGMAQVNVWNALVSEGFGVNIQHYGNLTEGSLAEKYGIPSDWKLQSELVVGEKLAEPGEKTFMDDSERFRVFGAE